MPQDTPQVPPPFLSQELQELGGEGRALRPVSFRSESRGAPGSTGSQGEAGALSVHQGLPIPEQRGTHKGLIPTTCHTGNLELC